MDILDHIPDPVSSHPSPRFTAKQGQYLAFIHTYALLHREPPAEADFQRFFQVTPPAVHDMIVALERRGLISRVPRQPRTIRLLLCRLEHNAPGQHPLKHDTVLCGGLTE